MILAINCHPIQTKVRCVYPKNRPSHHMYSLKSSKDSSTSADSLILLVANPNSRALSLDFVFRNPTKPASSALISVSKGLISNFIVVSDKVFEV